ncbi:uncharacterized protein K452DRAFT_164094 [Aplosporella prunicola CBS 121167]|uniref:Uncharacterized protein n=1 Tax=Aplosporella prunicola CBS 121167 TaxID=1176127 RepID=A0A6A6BKV5_9PEZI|nr:uncharacterized protein K452DRAFT_164094 [Aplosporella prunicola CBS 121167]KAF2143904.1 hypothetical protein K452DRAFT_164094 [Aplosporella prunicola CBS 121167]
MFFFFFFFFLGGGGGVAPGTSMCFPRRCFLPFLSCRLASTSRDDDHHIRLPHVIDPSSWHWRKSLAFNLPISANTQHIAVRGYSDITLPDYPDHSEFFTTVMNQPHGLPNSPDLLPSDPAELSSMAPEATSEPPTLESDLPEITLAPAKSESTTERRPRKRQKVSHDNADDDFSGSQHLMEPRTRSRRAIPLKKYVEADSDADFEVIPWTNPAV